MINISQKVKYVQNIVYILLTYRNMVNLGKSGKIRLEIVPS